MDIVIVGNGVAGITCALAARRRDPGARVVVVSGESDYFFSRTALMYAFMDRMTRRDLEPYERRTWGDLRIDLVRDWVVDLDPTRREVTLHGGRTLAYDRLVLAVGARPNAFPWDGLDRVRDGVVHFVSMQDLDACERLTPSTREAVVVGGGLIGIELVECLVHHGIRTTFLVREPWYWPVALGWEEAEIVGAHMAEHGVDLRLAEEVRSVEAGGDGRVAAVRTAAGERIPCQMLGVAIGVSPNLERIRAFRGAPLLGKGIVVDETLETTLPGVFACGDCVEIRPREGRPYGEQIWYSAKRQGAICADNLFGDKRSYRPPLFFNSSKFFDVEYTTVGSVTDAPEGTPTVYMRLPGRPVAVRIVHDGGRVLGFNMLGSRWDHEVLEGWIREGRSAEFVRRNLPQAQFDVEFGRAPLHRMEVQDLPLGRIAPAARAAD
ncbi:NAD(P)/FAD-dependent oxidoreductase [Myxococcota bacterium]|nr:NAD(P)/FAD-dependent oxidoreductase [Myxococcota bacterium]